MNYKKTVYMEVRGLSEAEKAISAYDFNSREKIKKIIKEGSENIRDEASRLAPMGKGGKLKHTMEAQSVESVRGIRKTKATRALKGDEFAHVAYSPERYAHLVEFGTKAHTVTPGANGRLKKPKKDRKTTKAMKVGGKNGGGQGYLNKRGGAYGMSATIPATKGQPFLEPAYEGERGHIERKIAKVLQEVKR